MKLIIRFLKAAIFYNFILKELAQLFNLKNFILYIVFTCVQCLVLLLFTLYLIKIFNISHNFLNCEYKVLIFNFISILVNSWICSLLDVLLETASLIFDILSKQSCCWRIQHLYVECIQVFKLAGRFFYFYMIFYLVSFPH